MLSLIDYTSLNGNDTQSKIQAMAEKVNKFPSIFKELKNVGAICVFPPFAEILKKTLTPNITNIACVSACFPASQSFIETKVLETLMCIKNGASEIDIVINVGKFLEGNKKEVFDEVKTLKNICGESIHLKVILETGSLKDPNQIWDASLLAMEAGADFIKTSTGKIETSATPEAVYVMCKAIKEFNTVNSKKIGLKPAGGIVTAEDALKFYTVVAETLGTDYCDNKLFRIGASRLANNLLTKIMGSKTEYF